MDQFVVFGAIIGIMMVINNLMMDRRLRQIERRLRFIKATSDRLIQADQRFLAKILDLLTKK